MKLLPFYHSFLPFYHFSTLAHPETRSRPLSPPEWPNLFPWTIQASKPPRPRFSTWLVVGAGPTGLACAIEAQKAGFRVVLVDKGCICNSLFHYPAHMTFFTTPELLEIGDIPFPSPNPKPTRNEALQYYRLVAAHYKLDIRQYHLVERVTGCDGAFTVDIVDRFGPPECSAVPQAGSIHWLLRPAQLHGHPG